MSAENECWLIVIRRLEVGISAGISPVGKPDDFEEAKPKKVLGRLGQNLAKELACRADYNCPLMRTNNDTSLPVKWSISDLRTLTAEEMTEHEKALEDLSTLKSQFASVELDQRLRPSSEIPRP